MSTPHKCPVCEGKGIVPNGFYLSLNTDYMSSNAAAEQCRACTGTGIVYVPHPLMTQPNPIDEQAIEEIMRELRNSPLILVNRQEESIQSKFIQHRHTDKEYSFAAVMPPCGSAIGFLRLNQSPDKDSPQGIDAMISHLSVSDSERGKGWGNAVLQELESIASQNGADEVFLFVDIDSWMHAWYLRKGYSYWADNIEQPETVWLRKELSVK